jgi:hypothetical protein
MTDSHDINLDNVKVVEKRGRDRPQGSKKNKPKSTGTAAASSSIPPKRRPGRPLGSKNRKSSAATADTVGHLDVSVSHHTLPSLSSGNLFSLFAFIGAQCHEQ